ncbi:nucleoside/nucleotide kinase family protein [Frigoribacterium sp. ACAM 257]|uniref:nucleoside/nucleotide kinase family protein n=1 Tax=Frigoribacterium sp. ACAM 257 TaxID=2508998 RepID=UPI0011B9848A|nr:nucleoside/nucleotide kinase family protein [Frigoribacterium sp. ACAM 257]TWX40057.1 nucleoside/nucleotide kinase family protein [Frigoribacterium sp. ACAM 257]
MPLSLDDAVAQVAGLRPTGRHVVVGLAGEPGSGKSTTATALAEALVAAGMSAVVVPMDGFHLAGAALARLGRLDRKGAIDTFDGSGWLALLRRLRRVEHGETVWAPDYVRGLEEAVAGSIEVAPDVEVVVVEGNYLLVDEEPWRSARAELDLAWWVEVPQPERIRRLVARHVRHGMSEEAALAWASGPDERSAALVRATRERADAVLAG